MYRTLINSSNYLNWYKTQIIRNIKAKAELLQNIE